MNLNCQKADDKLVHFLNDELQPSEYIFVENHLSECPVCQIEYRQLDDTMSVLRSIPQLEPPANLVLKIRRRLQEEQKNKTQNAPFFDLINLIFSRITAALKLGPRPVHINYAAFFCYLILAAFLIKLTFWTGNDSHSPTVVPNQSDNYVTVNPASTSKSNRNDITWAQVKMAGLRTSPDLDDDNREFSRKPQILRPIGSQVLHRGSWNEFK
jgi:hypothetical protein